MYSFVVSFTACFDSAVLLHSKYGQFTLESDYFVCSVLIIHAFLSYFCIL